MAAEMICTVCSRPTGDDPDFSKVPVEVVVELCRNWRCSECLDAADDKHQQLNVPLRLS